jgi:ABC-type multidrug transport system fused ATPase/permease subunit
MAIYAALGISQAIAFFFMGVVFAFFTYAASKNLHRAAIKRVIHAPMSFFETTPLGRIMNRFAKDVDTLDNMLGDALRMFCNTLSNIIGAVILISILLPWFLIAVASISLIYYFYAVFYRSSARELKVGFSRCIILSAWLLITYTASGCHPPVVTLLSLLRVAVRSCHHPCIWRGRTIREGQRGSDEHREPCLLAHGH